MKKYLYIFAALAIIPQFAVAADMNNMAEELKGALGDSAKVEVVSLGAASQSNPVQSADNDAINQRINAAKQEYERKIQAAITGYSDKLDTATLASTGKAEIKKAEEHMAATMDKADANIARARAGDRSVVMQERTNVTDEDTDEVDGGGTGTGTGTGAVGGTGTNANQTGEKPQTGADLLAQQNKYFDQSRADELQQKAAEAKAREQSLANRMLGGAAIGAAGIGGMQFMQGMAEKSADEESAADIAAYMDTINCSISGVGGRVRHGDTGIAPAFSASAIQLKSNFMTLADRTRAAKENLGLKPGIESEAIIDKSSLHNHEDFDIARTTRYDTAQQRLDSGDAANRMQRGQNLALGGIIGGFVGNLAINEIFPKIGAGDPTKYGGQVQEKIDAAKFNTTYRNVESLYGIECAGDNANLPVCQNLLRSLEAYKNVK